jgi:hypothetical protein
MATKIPNANAEDKKWPEIGLAKYAWFRKLLAENPDSLLVRHRAKVIAAIQADTQNQGL